jgi:hypothetical protein
MHVKQFKLGKLYLPRDVLALLQLEPQNLKISNVGIPCFSSY